MRGIGVLGLRLYLCVRAWEGEEGVEKGGCRDTPMEETRVDGSEEGGGLVGGIVEGEGL